MSTAESAVQFLQGHPLFRGVPESELLAAAGSMHEERFEAGSYLIEEGSYGSSCYFIKSGEVRITSRNLIGDSVTLDRLGEGALIGEVALFLEEKRTSSVQAIGGVTALRLEQNAFSRLAAASPMFHESLSFSARIRTMHAMLSKASIWAAIPNAELRGLAEVTVRRKVYKDDTILEEGVKSDRFYMISEGRFEVRSGRRKKQIFKAGDYFGEMDLLTGEAHTGTVKALESGELMVMGRDEFHFVLQQYEPVRRQFYEVLDIRRPDLLTPEVQAKLHFSAEESSSGGASHPTGVSEAAAAVTDGAAESASEQSRTAAVSNAAPARDRWMDIVLWLGGLFVLFTILAVWIRQPVWIFGALLTGGFLGPVTFVAYIRGSQLLGFRPARLALVFGVSALTTVPGAWVLERYLLQDPGLSGTAASTWRMVLTIAVVEEILKLAVCLVFLRGRTGRFLMDAIVFGAAAGMGFAALESILYGWTYLQQGAAPGMLAVLWVRALLSPFGHGTWTAIAAAGIWYGMSRRGDKQETSGSGRGKLVLVMLGILLSILLHSVWNYPYANGGGKLIGMVSVGVAGIALLYLLLRIGAKEEIERLGAVNPERHTEHRLQDTVGNQPAEGTSTSNASGKSLVCDSCRTVSPPASRYCARCGQALQLKR
ncbi:cyclic nucleotide-binding domain-containing protein [Paenibacillus lemnae]|uniref:Cyclic nucleotide-binding domain-containing protein n=1 Tax=Paenibacillus lemnae TaxID=1330551 RepID=A0A848M4L4_PAELE|nr:cyclic nucleotide-binding domain-containing protein [Paenibacillus lemnae]NMO95052.1 cyclic nucleotide-binding domain-containing protein [Paenibacillus lemnae]